MSTEKKKKSPESITHHAFQAAFDKTAAQRAKLEESAVLRINLDVPLTVTAVLAAVPGTAKLRDAIVEEIPGFDIKELDMIKTYAEALACAHTAYLAASQPAEDLPDLAARANQMRALLLSDATALAHRGLLDSEPLDELKGGVGFLNVASDVAVLARMMRDGWERIASKTAARPEELDEAEDLFERVTVACAARAQEPAVLAAADDRHRAFTLLVNAYDGARRAATYLRWNQGDADEFVPSLWAGRGGRGTTSSEVVPPSPSPAPTPAPAPPAPAANGTNGASVQSVAPGLPGGLPFTH